MSSLLGSNSRLLPLAFREAAVWQKSRRHHCAWSEFYLALHMVLRPWLKLNVHAREQSITTRAFVRVLKLTDKSRTSWMNQCTLLSKEPRAPWTPGSLPSKINIDTPSCATSSCLTVPQNYPLNKVSATLTFSSRAPDLPSVTICLHHGAISSNQVWLVPRRGVSVPRGYTKASRSDPCVKAHNCFLLKSSWFYLFFLTSKIYAWLWESFPCSQLQPGHAVLKLFIASRPQHEH